MSEKKAAPVLSAAAWELGEQDHTWKASGLPSPFSVPLRSPWKVMKLSLSFSEWERKLFSLGKQGLDPTVVIAYALYSWVPPSGTISVNYGRNSFTEHSKGWLPHSWEEVYVLSSSAYRKWPKPTAVNYWKEIGQIFTDIYSNLIMINYVHHFIIVVAVINICLLTKKCLFPYLFVIFTSNWRTLSWFVSVCYCNCIVILLKNSS